MKMLKVLASAFLAVLVVAGDLSAKVTLPNVFGSNMVLQQKSNVVFWGKADAGKTVTLYCSWSKRKYSAPTDQEGNFKLTVATPGYGGPYFIVISDGATLKLDNVMIGDVWICSGQSNMEMPLAGWGKVNNYQAEIAAANYPNIRLLQVEKQVSALPMGDAKVGNGWAACTPTTVADFSSTAYFFAREINKKTGVPIGLIHTSWGGTVAEAWMSGKTLQGHPDFAAQVKAFEMLAKSATASSEEAQLNQWRSTLLAKDSGYGNGKLPWLAASALDADWKTMSLPGMWETSILPNFDGVVYLRKEINIPTAWAGKPLNLHLGAIDDEDITYFDGQKIGETKGYNVQRFYQIPADKVTAGKHVIAVRVFDGGGGGGIYVDDHLFSVSVDGQTPISLAGDWKYAIGLNLKDVAPSPALRQDVNRATLLYNAMIHPFVQFKIKGAIWYQGEANVERAHQYRTLFPDLITDWRTQWGIGDFPFYFVQLANFLDAGKEPVPSAWAELRDAQRGALQLANTGMAVAIDIGEAKDIHPKNKQEVGRRLALIALAKNYGKPITFTGPVYLSNKKENHTIKLTFAAKDGLFAKGGALKGFAIAGADQKFYWADATIKGNEVVVNSKMVAQPIAVRYAWADNPNGNLYGKDGLPASPFKTDNWKDSTNRK